MMAWKYYLTIRFLSDESFEHLNCDGVDSQQKLNSKEMIDEADRDGDGEVSQDEFLRIMKKTSLY